MKTTVLIFCALLVISSAHAQWEQMSGLSDRSITAFTDNGLYIFAGTANDGVDRSSNNGFSWSNPSDRSMHYYIDAFIVNDTNLFISDGSSIFLSSNNGVNWLYVDSGIPKSTGGNYGTTITIPGLNRIGTRIFASVNAYVQSELSWSGYEVVYQSTNNGTNWEPDSNVTDLYDATPLVSMGANFFAGAYGGVLVSNDSGMNWSPTNNADLINTQVDALTTNGICLFAGSFGKGVYVSFDNGTNWGPVNSGLTNDTILSFAVSGNYVFVGTKAGIFLTSNNGGTWNNIDTGLININIPALLIHGSYIYAGTAGNGVWRRPLAQVLSGVHEQSVNELSNANISNYPNPFSSSTTISYSLPEYNTATLKIYDALGRQVADLSPLLRGTAGGGVHSVQFDGANLPNGMYFYRLTAGTFSQGGEMAVMK